MDPNDPDDKQAGPTFGMMVDGEFKTAGLMLDAQWRWLHTADYQSCDDSKNATFNEDCILQGLSADDYKNNYGISADGDEVTLDFATMSPYGASPCYGSRAYVTDVDAGGYASFELLGKSLSFTVDLRDVPAGMNAALYLVSMDSSGNLDADYGDGRNNSAGWQRGVGYCDAQCPTDLHFVQGRGWNSGGSLASCCPEMDLLEANRLAAAMTPHPCLEPVQTVCDKAAEGADCSSSCDSIGGDMNPYRSAGPGNEIFSLVDVQSGPITVVTSFPVDPATGALGSVVQTLTDAAGVSFTQTLTDGVVAAQKASYDEADAFGPTFGGTASMGDALARGMVLVLSIWDDGDANMNWLDSCLAADYQTYDCAAHAEFADPAAWAAAFGEDGAGAWRGPADWYPSADASYRSANVTFANPAIPEPWRDQSPFHCPPSVPVGSDGGGDDDALPFDCSGNTYRVVVGALAVSAIGSEPSPAEVAAATAAAAAARESRVETTSSSTANSANMSKAAAASTALAQQEAAKAERQAHAAARQAARRAARRAEKEAGERSAPAAAAP